MENYNAQHCDLHGHEWIDSNGSTTTWCVHCGFSPLIDARISVLQGCMLGFSRQDDGRLHADWTRFTHLHGPAPREGT